MTDISPEVVRAAANQATQEAGDASSNNAIMPCSRINLGVFFDGTWNNRFLVGTDKLDSYHTNVDFMELIYSKDVDSSSGCNVHCGSEYIMGIGTDESGTDIRGGVTGTGPTGVYHRVNDSVERLMEKLDELSENKPQIEVLLDVFGFSRGAAAARYFCNLVTKEGKLDGVWGKPKIRFLGLYDCVGSIGLPGDDQENNVDISTPAAQHVVHITADDEIRKNFPLTLASKGIRRQMPGAHADIGGAYHPGLTEGTSIMRRTPIYEFIRDNHLSDDEVLIPPLVGAASAKDGASSVVSGRYEWKAHFGLSDVAFNVMHYYATNHYNVPLGPVPESRQVVDDLKGLYDQMIGKEASVDIDYIRKKYVHFSASMGEANNPESNATRTVFIK